MDVIKNNSQISLLKDLLTEDQMALFYKGEFEDEQTFEIISVMEAGDGLGNKEKKKLGFLIAESFQNVVRHKDNPNDDTKSSVFGLRKTSDIGQIYTCNKVEKDVAALLKEKLKKFGSLSKEELKELYRELLNENSLSSKGGAGLGLLEMVRKTKRPLQYQFINTTQADYFDFNLQLELLLNKNEEVTSSPDNIDKNIQLSHQVIKEYILFFYKGEFDDNMLHPMLNILESNSDGSDKANFKLVHTSVELMQNISRHRAKNDLAENNGIFCIQEYKDYFYLSSGNYATPEAANLIEKEVEVLNKLNKSELDSLYRERLKASVKKEESNAKVGLIDMKRYNYGHKMDLTVIKDNNNPYIVIGVIIEK